MLSTQNSKSPQKIQYPLKNSKTTMKYRKKESPLNYKILSTKRLKITKNTLRCRQKTPKLSNKSPKNAKTTIQYHHNH